MLRFSMPKLRGQAADRGVGVRRVVSACDRDRSRGIIVGKRCPDRRTAEHPRSLGFILDRNKGLNAQTRDRSPNPVPGHPVSAVGGVRYHRHEGKAFVQNSYHCEGVRFGVISDEKRVLRIPCFALLEILGSGQLLEEAGDTRCGMLVLIVCPQGVDLDRGRRGGTKFLVIGRQCQLGGYSASTCLYLRSLPSKARPRR